MAKRHGKQIEEYLRRNDLHAASVGLIAELQKSLGRLRAGKSPPRWLMRSLHEARSRAERISAEMARHRDEVSPW